MIITKETVAAFCNLSGDHNPIHLDEKYAAGTKFGSCIVPGTQMSAIFGGMIAAQYPGAVLINQYIEFIAPVFIDQEFDLILSETVVREYKAIIHINAVCNGRVLTTSQSLISKVKI